MVKPTLYLPDDLKRAVSRAAATRQTSEAELMRSAIAEAVAGFDRPKPVGGFLDGCPVVVVP